MNYLLFCITGALLLIAPLSTGARAVTWSRCMQDWDSRGRVREPGTDDGATTLHLYRCNIEDLPDDTFNGLPNLEDIYLYSNKIEHVNPAVFIPVRYITGRLVLSANKLREVPDFGEHSLFPRLTRLDLGSNLITALDNPNALSACRQLVTLDLSDNSIFHVHPEYFAALKDLKELRLSNNKLKIVTDNMFNIKSLSAVYLDNNIIEYVVPRAFHGSGLIQLRLYNNRITQLPANFVWELNRAGASLDTLYIHNNPWQCACLLELMADMKRAGAGMAAFAFYTNIYFSYEYNGKRSECVYTGPFPCLRPSGLLSPPSPHHGGTCN